VNLHQWLEGKGKKAVNHDQTAQEIPMRRQNLDSQKGSVNSISDGIGSNSESTSDSSSLIHPDLE